MAARYNAPNPHETFCGARAFMLKYLQRLARPERFELPTPRFVVWCSIQLSYGRAGPLKGCESERLKRARALAAFGEAGKSGLRPANVRIRGSGGLR
jgi:hypothetical protein